MIAWKGSLYRVDHTKLEATLVEGKSVEFAEDPKRYSLQTFQRRKLNYSCIRGINPF